MQPSCTSAHLILTTSVDQRLQQPSRLQSALEEVSICKPTRLAHGTSLQPPGGLRALLGLVYYQLHLSEGFSVELRPGHARSKSPSNTCFLIICGLLKILNRPISCEMLERAQYPDRFVLIEFLGLQNGERY